MASSALLGQSLSQALPWGGKARPTEWQEGGDPFLTNQGAAVRVKGETKKSWLASVPHPMDFLNDFAIVLSLIMVPWLILLIIACLFAFVYHMLPIVVWIVVLFSAIFAVGLFLAGGGSPDGQPADRDSVDRADRNNPFARKQYYMPSVYLVLGMLCMVATFFGTILGYWNYHTYMSFYWTYETNGVYTNLMPSEPAVAHADAGKIIFSDFTRVDTTRAAGYKDGTVYCAAPILDDVPIAKVEYWAVGTNCCSQRADFNCDDSWNPKAKSGMVVLESNPWIPNNHDQYMNAVRLAEATFQIISAKEPIFVRWVAEPEVVQDDFYRSGIGFFLAEIFIYLLASVIFGLMSLGAVQRTVSPKV